MLFLVVDDLNDWVGCLGGHPQTRTPNIDALAARGVVFANAHCASPSCQPSRVAVLTGRFPHQTGIHDNAADLRAALPDAVTLPQHFSAAGYLTLGAGKVFHRPDPSSWDTRFPERETDLREPRPGRRPLNGLQPASSFDWGPLDVADEETVDGQVSRWAAQQLGREFERPFFLACGFERPHLPWYVPAEHFEPFPESGLRLPETLADDLADVPAAAREHAARRGDHAQVLASGAWAGAVRAYLAAVHFADRQVGRVLDELAAGPHARNTVVVLWSDHGVHLGEKQHWRKNSLWEESTRVPLIIVAPDARAGGRCERPVSLVDLFPTLVELCGLEPRADLAGQSLAPLLADPSAARGGAALTAHEGAYALRSQDWRYVRHADGSEELYDHRTDPNEWTNLAGKTEHDAVREELGALLPTDAARTGRGEPARERR